MGSARVGSLLSCLLELTVPIQAPVTYLRVPFCIMESLANQDSAGECEQNNEFQHHLQFSFPR